MKPPSSPEEARRLLLDTAPERVIQSSGDSEMIAKGAELIRIPDRAYMPHQCPRCGYRDPRQLIPPGILDSLYLFPGLLVWREYKTAKGRLTKEQARILDLLGPLPRFLLQLVRPATYAAANADVDTALNDLKGAK